MPDSGPPPATAPGRWLREHALLVEIILTSGVFLYDLMYLTNLYFGSGGLGLAGFAMAFLLSVSICVLFLLRRKAPLRVAVVVFLASWGNVLLGIGYGIVPLVVLAAMLYFLGTRFDWRIVVPATVAVGAWMVVAGLPMIHEGLIRIGEAGMLFLVDVLAATFGLMTRTRRRHVAGLQEFSRQLARERDAQARVAAAEERARIAREIHDIVAHSLGTMVVVADGASRTAEAEPGRASTMMAQVRDTGRDAMTDMRRMLDVLRDDELPSRTPQPGLGQLDRLVGELRATGVRVDVSVAGTPFDPPPGVDLAAYRIVQEAFSNARKHGGPMLSRVKVSVLYDGENIDVRVIDDGQGPTPGLDDASGGHGLVGMRERVTAYGGSLSLRSPESGGFEVRASLPVGGGA